MRAIILLILMGCGHADHEYYNLTVRDIFKDLYEVEDPELLRAIDEFENTMGVEVYTPFFMTSDLPKNKEGRRRSGVCVLEHSGPRSIVIHEHVLDFSYLKKKALVWHELAHCIFDLEHIEEVDDLTCPASLMGPVLPNDFCLSTFEYKYFSRDNLFYDQGSL